MGTVLDNIKGETKPPMTKQYRVSKHHEARVLRAKARAADKARAAAKK